MKEYASRSLRSTDVIVQKDLRYAYIIVVDLYTQSIVKLDSMTLDLLLLQGRNCEIDVNMCRSNPCLNGGTCSNFPNTFMCSCVPGFTGYICSDIDECAPSPCVRGSCIVNSQCVKPMNSAVALVHVDNFISKKLSCHGILGQ